MASVLCVNLSEQKGMIKHPVEVAELRKNHGIVGDAHAGDWHRQVSLLAEESVAKMRAQCDIALPYGVFAENIDTEGMDLKALPVGAVLRVGECLLEITQIGKECHSNCAIKQQVGHCVMPTEGVFAKVIAGGHIRAGDAITRENERPE
ncbi:MAG: MOSC domain-containing protein [Clostridia bacterium]